MDERKQIIDYFSGEAPGAIEAPLTHRRRPWNSDA
jgi:hypothetical protein